MILPTAITVTPAESSFMPIDGDKPSLIQQTMDSSLHSELLSRADREVQHGLSGNPGLDVQPPGLKRSGTAQDEDVNAKRVKYQWSIPATPSSSPFRTLRVTKSQNISNRTLFPKVEEDASGGSQYPLGWTTMNQLTPYPTRREQEVVSQLDHNPVAESVDALDETSSPFFAEESSLVPVTFPYTPATVDASQDLSCANLAGTAIIEPTVNSEYLTTANNRGLWQDVNKANGLAKEQPPGSTNLNSGAGFDLEDEYPLGDGLMEEDIACLLDKAMNDVQETHMPPSSVTLAWDHDSRSAVEYDPTLKYSSPLSSSGKPKDSQSTDVAEKPNDTEYDLLDEDVDWNAVYAMASTVPKDPSTTGLQGIARPSLGDGVTYMGKPVEHSPRIKDDAMPLNPFVRPPFPEKARDRSVIPGLSSNTVLRTCFRTGEMINQAANCLNHRQDVVFELFARVTYSSRESLQRRQHFQFVDLFKDQRPYPAGVLSDWRVGSQLDRQSSVFLSTSSEPRICRCVCKPIRDPKIAIRFSLVILAIREIDWMQVRWAKKIVGGGSDDAA
ncbi:hypothetical protein F5Y13DRAFT_154198 [Hypoxylon sp. FL1857]|nr:hypothetical protein F5Y13DRAFT_154198 [Hypoxylon sp. FL1857]